jgi:hypothetical protein
VTVISLSKGLFGGVNRIVLHCDEIAANNIKSITKLHFVFLKC